MHRSAALALLALLASPALASTTTPTLDEDVALAADDECLASEGPGCALNALQLRAQGAGKAAEAGSGAKPKGKKLHSSADDDEAVVEPQPDIVWYQCHPPENTTCPDGMQCVQQADKGYAQCVHCTDKVSWKRDCVKYNDPFRLAAIKACGLACPDSRCYNEEWCPGSSRCAIQGDNGWGQCFPCTEAYYKDHCAGWPEKLWQAAKKVCHLKCEARQLALKKHHH